jgi:hypothetical protein
MMFFDVLGVEAVLSNKRISSMRGILVLMSFSNTSDESAVLLSSALFAVLFMRQALFAY